MEWEKTFRARMRGFEGRRPPQQGEASVSIKVRVTSGCFHREHSPQAYALIDQQLMNLPDSQREFSFEEHESGPEILAYASIATAGVTLAASVITIVTAIINARSQGVKRGDSPRDSIELVVRRADEHGVVRDEVVLRVNQPDHVGKELVKDSINKALATIAGNEIEKRKRKAGTERR